MSQEERTLSNMRNVATNVQDDSVLVCYGERACSHAIWQVHYSLPDQIESSALGDALDLIFGGHI